MSTVVPVRAVLVLFSTGLSKDRKKSSDRLMIVDCLGLLLLFVVEAIAGDAEVLVGAITTVGKLVALVDKRILSAFVGDPDDEAEEGANDGVIIVMPRFPKMFDSESSFLNSPLAEPIAIDDSNGLGEIEVFSRIVEFLNAGCGDSAVELVAEGDGLMY
jgi:hypothetical protein